MSKNHWNTFSEEKTPLLCTSDDGLVKILLSRESRNHKYSGQTNHLHEGYWKNGK